MDLVQRRLKKLEYLAAARRAHNTYRDRALARMEYVTRSRIKSKLHRLAIRHSRKAEAIGLEILALLDGEERSY